MKKIYSLFPVINDAILQNFSVLLVLNMYLNGSLLFWYFTLLWDRKDLMSITFYNVIGINEHNYLNHGSILRQTENEHTIYSISSC